MSNYRAYEWSGKKLLILDQRKLPLEIQTLSLEDGRQVGAAISSLAIRGAPNIGVAAAYGFSMDFSRQPSLSKMANYCAAVNTRPTAVNLERALARCMNAADEAFEVGGPQAASNAALEVKKTAQNIDKEEVDSSYAMVEHALPLLRGARSFITICNTGILAAPGMGTALGALIAHNRVTNGDMHVAVMETRPLMQGSRLTAWELRMHEVPHSVIADGAIYSAIRRFSVDAAVVGADRITASGDVVNKIGTRSLAEACRVFKVPFYVVAPESTFDYNIENGEEVQIEERSKFDFSPEDPEVVYYNPAFDVTPSRLVSAFISEEGVRHKTGKVLV